jgi:ABC-2 type transport system permease protein
VNGRSVQVALGVARRHLRKVLRDPALLMPPLVMPLLLFLAFAGGMSAVAKSPNFGYPDYTAFQLAFVLLMSSGFCGAFAAFSLAKDFETGFARRLMIAAPQRLAVIGGYQIAALIQALASGALVFAVALATGMSVHGNAPQMLAFIVVALAFNQIALLFGAGVAMRLRSVQAAPLMQLPVFIVLFLTPVYTPRNLLAGWLHTAAGINPVTPLLESMRGYLAGDPVSVGLAFGCAAAMILVFAGWTVLSLRSAERSL